MGNTARIYIETTNLEIVHLAGIELADLGVQVEEMLLKSNPGKLRSLILHVSVAAGVVGNIIPVAEWIYSKLKDKPDAQTVINGNQINAQNVAVQTIQIYLCDQKYGCAKK